MVGVDLAVLIEKQELLSLKLLDAALETSLAATSSHAEAVVVELSIDDISIRDLQVSGTLSTCQAHGHALGALWEYHYAQACAECSSLMLPQFPLHSVTS